MAEEGYAAADDAVCVVLYETVLKRGKLILLRTRGENGNTSEFLPEEWDHVNVKGYAFATTKDGKATSDSVCDYSLIRMRPPFQEASSFILYSLPCSFRGSR